MKILKFNESIEPPDNFENHPKLSDEINNFLDEFGGSTDYGIPDWIDSLSYNTKLKEYRDFTSSNKKMIKIADEKNIPNLKKYIILDAEINKLEKQINKNKNLQNKLYTLISNELIYKFQEELLEKDFDNFYVLFLKDAIEDANNDNTEIIYYDVHPEILKKYGDEIEMRIDANNYNL